MATLSTSQVSCFLASPHLRPALGEHLQVRRAVQYRSPKLWVSAVRAQASVAQELQGYWQHVQTCNAGQERQGEFLPFILERNRIGHMYPRFLKHLRRFPEVFTVRDDEDNLKSQGWVTLHELLQSPRERTDAIESVLRSLELEGLVPGWRNEVLSNQIQDYIR